MMPMVYQTGPNLFLSKGHYWKPFTMLMTIIVFLSFHSPWRMTMLIYSKFHEAYTVENLELCSPTLSTSVVETNLNDGIFVGGNPMVCLNVYHPVICSICFFITLVGRKNPCESHAPKMRG